MTGRTGRLAGSAAMLGCLLSACGLPAENEPHAVQLPRSPLTTPTTGVAGTEPAGEVGEILCFVRDGRLVQVVRRVNAQPSAARQLEQLIAGPTEGERVGGLTTALAATSLSVDVPTGTTEARVELSGTDEGTARSDETIAYGQVVCTLTSRLDVNTVVFIEDGQVLQVPRADGSLSSEPLRGSDYAGLIGPS